MFKPKEVGPSGTDTCAFIYRNIQYLCPPSQASRDQAQNGICQQSRSLARSRGTYNQQATLRCLGCEPEGQTSLDPVPLRSSHHRQDCARIAGERIALDFLPSNGHGRVTLVVGRGHGNIGPDDDECQLHVDAGCLS